MKSPLRQRAYGEFLYLIRVQFDLTQVQFWKPLGVGQSGASRYESGERRLPVPTRKLVEITLHGVTTRKSLLQKLKRMEIL